MSTLIGMFLRRAAEGDYGPRMQQLYWAIKGYKTWTGFVLSVSAYAFHEAYAAGLCPNCSTWSTYVASVGAFLLAVGLVDGGLHLDPPRVGVEPKR